MNNQFDELTKGLAQSVTRSMALKKFGVSLAGMALAAYGLAAAADAAADIAPTKRSATIPWSQLGTKAEADYQGDGLAVIPTSDGARLRCVFQRLEGEATSEGLWLTSTVTDAVSDRFHVMAAEVGRQSPTVGDEVTSLSFPKSIHSETPYVVSYGKERFANSGTVEVADKVVRFLRLGVIEEYSVTMDGVRQDFIIAQRPSGSGELVVRLAVTGARAEPAANGAQLVLENSGRKIAYSRLRVTDATGKELTARMEVPAKSEILNPKSGISLAVLVNDADAVYPVRIDPTFSDANWMSMGGYRGTSGYVYAAVTDASRNLYIGGSFTIAGNVLATNIAKWNGTSWSALGWGTNGKVLALAVSGSDLYAGGYFTSAGGVSANYIAKWNGSSWSAFGSGIGSDPSAYVGTLAVAGSNLYAGGYFTSAGGSPATNIAKWNGASWSALGSGVNGDVYALAVAGSELYAGGGFTKAGGSAARSVAKWNGSSWSALGSGLGGRVLALAVSGSELYAGGEFITLNSPANYVAKWNGSSWSALGPGMNWSVYALAASGSDLYAGGLFTAAGGNPANRIARWNGSSWSSLDSGVGDPLPTGDATTVYALTLSGSDLYAGGNFTTAGDSAANCIAKWNGASWSGLGSDSGVNNTVYALAVLGSDLYAGGLFTTVGSAVARHIAKWDGSSWSALGSGMGGSGPSVTSVEALAVLGSDLYAGGHFTTAGGIAATNIAKWDGASWSALGSGLGNAADPSTYMSVYALAVSGTDLYAGGFFDKADVARVDNIAKWDGTSWSALGSGMDNNVYALAVSGADIYSGGMFLYAGGVRVSNIAKWDGTSWSAVGSGVNGDVYALAVSGSDLYVGGNFTTAGGIAKWDGSSWSAMGSGMGGGVVWRYVTALAVSGGDLYVGGNFTTAGGITATNIAKWNGASWSALGSGMSLSDPYNPSVVQPAVYALAVRGGNVYAGGRFQLAGGKVSTYIARAYLPTLPTLSILRSGIPQGEILVSWPSADTAGFMLEQAGTLVTPTNSVTDTAAVTDDGTNKSVTIPSTNNSQFFRLRGP